MNESLKDREQRKANWIARATAHMDSPRIRREAEEIFNKRNPINSWKEKNVQFNVGNNPIK